jgi:predicted protein tyrosine phosphatase
MWPEWAEWLLGSFMLTSVATPWSTDAASRWSFSLLAVLLPSLFIVWWRRRDSHSWHLHEQAAVEMLLSRALNLTELELERLLFETNNPTPTHIPLPQPSCQGLGCLYLGNARNAADLKALQNFKITHVLNTTESLPNHFTDQATYSRVVLHENDDEVLVKLEKAVTFLKAAMSSPDHSVLVHCQHGVSHSPVVVAAFLIDEMTWSTDKALQHIQQLRFIRIFPRLEQNLRLYQACMVRGASNNQS